MKVLENKMPPAFLFIALVGLMYWLDTASFAVNLNLPFAKLVFAVCFVAAGIFGMGGLYEFKRHKTSVHPVNLSKVKKVVDTGIYNYSRNPMYFGLLLLLFAYAYWQGNVWSLLTCGVFVLYMNKFQIMPEETHLEEKFGAEYREYKERVRRWI